MKTKKNGSQLFMLVVTFLGIKTKQDSTRRRGKEKKEKKKKRGTGLLLFLNFSKFSSYRELGCSLLTRAKHVPTHIHANFSIKGLLDWTKGCWARKTEICDSNYCSYISCLTPRKPFYAGSKIRKQLFSVYCFTLPCSLAPLHVQEIPQSLWRVGSDPR